MWSPANTASTSWPPRGQEKRGSDGKIVLQFVTNRLLCTEILAECS